MYEQCIDMGHVMFVAKSSSRFDASFNNAFRREEYMARTYEELLLLTNFGTISQLNTASTSVIS